MSNEKKPCENCPWSSPETCKVCKQDKKPADNNYVQKISMN
ncbi:hypothetical protein LCGC14_1079190 [marine sediment metagenome]|uniref:Uncharacterized protein n=1 Tax=marine sediment metagenome TaxID=412755 RepID=A0A0F9QLL1_9ZZZZ